MVSDENLKQLRAMMAELLEEYGFKKVVDQHRTLNAERQRRFRERNAGRNAKVTRTRAKRNGHSNASVTDESPIIITIPLVGDRVYEVHKSLADELEKLYPAVDVPQTLRELRGWNLTHATQRKTPRGILKHINGWFAKEQNKG